MVGGWRLNEGVTTSPLVQRRVSAAAGIGTAVLAWLLLGRAASMGPHAGWLPHRHGDGPDVWLMAAAMWQLMMVAMMLPVVWPWLRMVAVTHAGPTRGPLTVTTGFAAGYFVAWGLYAAAAASAQVWLQSLELLGADMALRRPLAGTVLVVAGAFQFTRLKQACLKHCRSPLGYLLARWDNAPPGVFRLGFTHGLFCVACCWALMALCLALGLMNLAWMGMVTAIAVLEQLAPGGARVARLIGVVLVAWGVSLWW